jgi:hypothetical protein
MNDNNVIIAGILRYHVVTDADSAERIAQEIGRTFERVELDSLPGDELLTTDAVNARLRAAEMTLREVREVLQVPPNESLVSTALELRAELGRLRGAPQKSPQMAYPSAPLTQAAIANWCREAIACPSETPNVFRIHRSEIHLAADLMRQGLRNENPA